jgi:hypothetical protein
MVELGTYFIEEPALQSAPPPVTHDAPTQPAIRRPTPLAVMLAQARLYFLAITPIERAGLVAIVSIWAVALLLLSLVAGMLTYDTFFANKDLMPARQAILDPRSFKPLVHIGIEPLTLATPATQPAAPAAAHRAPVILVVPAQGAPAK